MSLPEEWAIATLGAKPELTDQCRKLGSILPRITLMVICGLTLGMGVSQRPLQSAVGASHILSLDKQTDRGS